MANIFKTIDSVSLIKTLRDFGLALRQFFATKSDINAVESALTDLDNRKIEASDIPSSLPANGGNADYATSAGSVDWDGVKNKPTSFTPSSHTHTTSEITNFPTSLPANGGNADTATALTSNAGDSVNPIYFSGGKPVACTMSTGAWYGIVRSFMPGTYTSANQFFGNGTIVTIDPLGTGCISNNDTILSLGFHPTRNTQLLVPYDRDGVYYRRINDDLNYGSWKKLAFTSDIPTSLPANGGNADYATSAGNASTADSVDWSGVTNKPSSFTPSSHTHTKSEITDFPTSLPANGGNADYATSAGNAKLHNGYTIVQTNGLTSTIRDFTLGTLVRTSIDYSVAVGDSFYVEIKGNTYHSAINSCFTQIQGYIYDNTIIAYGVTHLGVLKITPITAMNIDGKLCFWFPRLGYWMGFDIRCYTGTNYAINTVTSIENSADPGGTKRVTLTENEITSYHSGNLTSSVIGNLGTLSNNISGNAATAGNADTVDGKHASDFATAEHTHSYLPLSGGTIINTNTQTPLIIDATGMGDFCGISYINGSYRPLGSIGFAGINTPAFKSTDASSTSWKILYHSGNLTASVIGGLGTLSNDISGNAATATNADNADTLDGKHASDFATAGHNHDTSYLKLSGGTLNGGIVFKYGSNNSDQLIEFSSANTDNPQSVYLGIRRPVNIYGLSYLDAEGNWYSLLHQGNYTSFTVKKDGTGASGTWGINISGNAATSSNADNATKLQTARTIWGQSFDGTGNVSGALTDVSSISATGKITTTDVIFGYRYNTNTNSAAFVFDKPGSHYTGIGSKGEADTIRFGACSGDGSWVDYAQKWYFHGDIHSSGSVGIGTTSPSYKLHVAGDIYTTDGFKKEGSNDNYVLLGGGGHKAESSLSVNYAASAGSVDWDNVAKKPTSLPANGGNADYATSAGNASTLGGRPVSDFVLKSDHAGDMYETNEEGTESCKVMLSWEYNPNSIGTFVGIIEVPVPSVKAMEIGADCIKQTNPLTLLVGDKISYTWEELHWLLRCSNTENIVYTTKYATPDTSFPSMEDENPDSPPTIIEISVSYSKTKDLRYVQVTVENMYGRAYYIQKQ